MLGKRPNIPRYTPTGDTSRRGPFAAFDRCQAADENSGRNETSARNIREALFQGGTYHGFTLFILSTFESPAMIGAC